MEGAYTGKERMEAAFNGEKLDRLPVFLLLGGHLAEEAGFTLTQVLTEPETAIEATKHLCEKIDSDILFVPFNPWLPSAQEAIRRLMGKAPSIKREDIEEKLPNWHVRDAKEDKLFGAHLDVREKTIEIFSES